MEKHLLIDLGHLSHRLLFRKAIDIKQVGYGLLRNELLQYGIFELIAKFKPTTVYIGVDYKKSWRKDETSIYKANRVGHREKTSDAIDWNGFYEFMDVFLDELRDTFPFFTLAVPRLEADDIIGYLAHELPANDKKIIVTSDTDYIQLLKYPNVELYCPMKHKMIECKNPNHQLELKIICGDKSDNIPPLRRGFGPKTVEKLLDNGELSKMLAVIDKDGNPCELKRNYDRNKKLIDLTSTPADLLEELKIQITNYKLATGSSLFRYLIQHQLRSMLGGVDMYRKSLSTLTQKGGLL